MWQVIAARPRLTSFKKVSLNVLRMKRQFGRNRYASCQQLAQTVEASSSLRATHRPIRKRTSEHSSTD
jgi:hypothetical protein